MTSSVTTVQIKVADEVWVAAALLHKERPTETDFSIKEILERAAKEGLHKPLRPGVYAHIVQHCVANREPDPGRYRMLFETAEGRRRLYRTGDSHHPDRSGSKTTPKPQDLPEKYGQLLQWYEQWDREQRKLSEAEDPLLKIRGAGAQLWKDESPDEYVERLREGWR